MQIQSHSYIKGQWDQALHSELDSEQTLVLCFAGRGFDQDDSFWQNLRSSFPLATLAGCSTSGEIHQESVKDHSASVAVVKFDQTQIRFAAKTIQTSTESTEVGQVLAEQLNAPDLRAILIFSDGLNVNGTELVQGFNQVLPPSVTISGGLAGDGSDFKTTWVIDQGKPCSHMVSAVGLYGDAVKISCGSKGGWDTFGPKRKVTKAARNVLFELDGKPALAVYKEYLGEQAKELPSSALLYPLALESDFMNRKEIVRTVLAINEDDQSMTFAGDIPEGSFARLMVANFDRLIDGAGDAASDLDHSSDSTSLCIAISCVGRKLILGERIEDETEMTLEQLSGQTTQIGFYSYGEISPSKVGNCDLHNQTMTLTLISE